MKGLKLINFRNYESLNVSFSDKFNIIYGNNAQGKTNILESIFLCASGRSHRTPKDSELVRIGEPGYYVRLLLEKESSDSTIEIVYNKEEKKKIKINEIPANKVGNLMGYLNAVIFSPEDLKVIKEGPSERRRFIDITLSQLKPSYFYDLQQYARILNQRNSLLKEIQKNKSLIDTLEVWNNKLVTIGSRIMKIRREFIKKLAVLVEKNHYKLTDETEKLELRYAPSIDIAAIEEVKEIETKFKRALDNVLNKDLVKCSTSFGPHRDEYELFLNDLSLKMYGSQGQQRTSVLSIKLAEIEIMKQDTGEYPVLLLDDVMSELDAKRQEYLLNNLQDIQTFITCTEKIKMEAGFYQVRKGVVAGE